MPYKVQLSGAAAADLDGARRWLQQRGAGVQAAERLKNIRTALPELRTSPMMWPEGEHEGTRARSVSGYKIVYRVAEGETRGSGSVDVVRVFGPGQSQDRL